MFCCKVQNQMEYGVSGMKPLLLFVVIILKTILCKGLALGIFLLLFWAKGKQSGFDGKKWDDFFLQLSPGALQGAMIAIYLTAAVVSSVASYHILEAASYPYSLESAVLLFVGGLAITAYNWRTKGKDFALKRYRELASTILSQRNRGKAEAK